MAGTLVGEQALRNDLREKGWASFDISNLMDCLKALVYEYHSGKRYPEFTYEVTTANTGIWIGLAEGPR